MTAARESQQDGVQRGLSASWNSVERPSRQRYSGNLTCTYAACQLYVTIKAIDVAAA